MYSTVRLHNFCRRRRVLVPTVHAGIARDPPVTFEEDHSPVDESFKTKPRYRKQHLSNTILSTPRKAIRHRLEMEGIYGPNFNITRNLSRRSGTTQELDAVINGYDTVWGCEHGPNL